MPSKEKCPYCGNEECFAEWCDVGVGLVQCGPYHCECCGASEIGPFDKISQTAKEKECGWYAPGKVSEHVSTIGGKIIDTQEALRLYKNGVVSEIPFHL